MSVSDAPDPEEMEPRFGEGAIRLKDFVAAFGEGAPGPPSGLTKNQFCTNETRNFSIKHNSEGLPWFG